MHSLLELITKFVYPNQVTICLNSKFDKRQFDIEKSSEFDNMSEFEQPNFNSMLKMASLFCDKKVPDHDNGTYDENIDVYKFLRATAPWQFQQLIWKNSRKAGCKTDVLTSEGICQSYNAIDANMIFRKDIVDPTFIEQYQDQIEDRSPKFWSFEKGYVANRFNNYPLRSLDKGKDSGIAVTLTASTDFPAIYDTSCRKNSLSYKIALHHPMEVSNGDFFLVPFNKSVSFYVKPKITKTAKSLETYDSVV